MWKIPWRKDIGILIFLLSKMFNFFSKFKFICFSKNICYFFLQIFIFFPKKFHFFLQIFIFSENFHFFSCKFSFFLKIFIFFWKFAFFSQNFHCSPNFHFFSKFLFFSQNFHFFSQFSFFPKFSFFLKISNQNFYVKLSLTIMENKDNTSQNWKNEKFQLFRFFSNF